MQNRGGGVSKSIKTKQDQAATIKYAQKNTTKTECMKLEHIWNWRKPRKRIEIKP